MNGYLPCCWRLCCAIGPAAPATKRAAENEIEIRSAQDLAQLAEQCALDTWSEGKIVRLRCDLDLSGMEFEPIPIFSGTFEGQGHTISGLRIGAEDSITGLFCIVAETSLIQSDRGRQRLSVRAGRRWGGSPGSTAESC